jgi:hypothetical protein
MAHWRPLEAGLRWHLWVWIVLPASASQEMTPASAATCLSQLTLFTVPSSWACSWLHVHSLSLKPLRSCEIGLVGHDQHLLRNKMNKMRKITWSKNIKYIPGARLFLELSSKLCVCVYIYIHTYIYIYIHIRVQICVHPVLKECVLPAMGVVKEHLWLLWGRTNPLASASPSLTVEHHTQPHLASSPTWTPLHWHLPWEVLLALLWPGLASWDRLRTGMMTIATKQLWASWARGPAGTAHGLSGSLAVGSWSCEAVGLHCSATRQLAQCLQLQPAAPLALCSHTSAHTHTHTHTHTSPPLIS